VTCDGGNMNLFRRRWPRERTQLNSCAYRVTPLGMKP
jgi:hypothetical protein